MDTLRLFISVLTIRVYLIIQVSLQLHAKAHFGSIIRWFYTWLCSPQACNNNNNNVLKNLNLRKEVGIAIKVRKQVVSSNQLEIAM